MVLSEDKIKKSIMDELFWDSSVDDGDVHVEVEDGEVSLTGTVSSYLARQAAERDAWVAGGMPVRNHLNVRKPSGRKPLSDEEIEEKINNALFWNPDIESSNLKVNVDTGFVTLEGTVESFWQKINVSRVAGDIAGVVNITNKLAVVPTRDIEDETIAERIIRALERNVYIDIEEIEVKVEGGKVTLSGTVPDWLAYDTVYSAAQFTSGVKEVINKLAIGQPTEL